MKAQRESDLVKGCRQLLALRGALAVRVNSGGVRAVNARGRGRLVKFNSEPGCSDLLACFRGRFVAVEVKRPGGRLTAAQKSFLEAVEVCGGVALVVTSVRQLQEALDRLGG